jgi:hypothetical protein
MAKILPFARGRAGRKPAAPQGTGEIVIFPGVRVEYHDQTPAPEAKQRCRRARRNSAEDVLSA